MKIYKAINRLNQKAYIGMTTDLKGRRSAHFHLANTGSNTHFHRALRKYNVDVWKWEMIAECQTREEASQMEKQMIVEHNTFGVNGYNSTTGGDGGWTHSPEARKKISEAHSGRKQSIESNMKRSETLRGRTAWNKGKQHTEVTKQKISESLKNMSDGTRMKMSLAKKGQIPWNKGKHLPNETKQRMSSAQKGRPWSQARRMAQMAKQLKKNS